MESQPQNPEFRNNPENFHPCEPHTRALVPLDSCGCMVKVPLQGR